MVVLPSFAGRVVRIRREGFGKVIDLSGKEVPYSLASGIKLIVIKDIGKLVL